VGETARNPIRFFLLNSTLIMWAAYFFSCFGIYQVYMLAFGGF
jgi:hypothetical protein